MVIKINAEQKLILVNYMAEHPNLAQNKILHDVEGQFIISSMWNELTQILNASGPPTRDEKSWRKVYIDHKYTTKKKLIFNKLVKQKTDGSPCKKKPINFTDIQIIEASGLNVEDTKFNESKELAYADVKNETEADRCSCSVGDDVISPKDCDTYMNKKPYTSKNKNQSRRNDVDDNDEMNSLTKAIDNQKTFYRNIEQKLNKLLGIQIERLAVEKEKLEIEKKRLLYKKMAFKIAKQNKII